MLVKSFCFAGAFAVVGAVAWSGCSGATAAPASSPDAGGSEGTSGGGTSGGVTPDGDSGPGQGGPDAAPPGVAITYGTCPAFTKCPGSAVGAWKLSGGCLSEDTFAAAKADCPDLKESNVVIKASGTLDVTAANLKRVSAITVTAHVQLPKSCFKNSPCALVETGLTIGVGGIKFDRAKCTESGALCECDVGSTYNDNIDATYTSTPDGTLTTAASVSNPQRTYDYCTIGAKMTFSETTAGQPLKLFVEIAK